MSAVTFSIGFLFGIIAVCAWALTGNKRKNEAALLNSATWQAEANAMLSARNEIGRRQLLLLERIAESFEEMNRRNSAL